MKEIMRKRRQRAEVPSARPGNWVAVRRDKPYKDMPKLPMIVLEARWELWDVGRRAKVAEVSRLETALGEERWLTWHTCARTCADRSLPHVAWSSTEEDAKRAAEEETWVRPW